MSVALYSPEDVTILIGGLFQVEGLQEGSFISISKGSPLYKTSVTTDGRVSRTYIKDQTHDVKLTVMATSDVNNALTAWAKTDSLLNGAMIPLFVKDGLGSTLFYAPLSWIEEIPASDFSTTVSSREWVIKTAGAEHFVGGNESQSGISSGLTAAIGIAADFAGLI